MKNFESTDINKYKTATLEDFLNRIPKDKLELITPLIEKDKLANQRIEEIIKALDNLGNEFLVRIDKLPQDTEQWEIEWQELLSWRKTSQKKLYDEWDLILSEQKKDSDNYLKIIEDIVKPL